jgi:hypothetical protein
MMYVVTVIGFLVASGYGFYMTLRCDRELKKEGIKEGDK